MRAEISSDQRSRISEPSYAYLEISEPSYAYLEISEPSYAFLEISEPSYAYLESLLYQSRGMRM